MARNFGGDSVSFRQSSVDAVADSIGLRANTLNENERRAFEDWSLVLSLIPDLDGWSKDEKTDLLNVIRAKAGADESRFVRLMQNHAKLREEIIGLGS